VFFSVTIAKGTTADKLTFDCLTNGSEFKVVGMELERADDDENVAYTGPDYKTLDPSLQDSVQTYLEARGINAELGSYIFDVQRDKESKMYMRWLTDVEKFLN
jgi:complement component 1 Q subcomponent-binding protein